MAITEFQALLEMQCQAVLAQLQKAGPNHMPRLDNERRKVEAAIDRLEAGTYGICCRCEEEVTPERLRADPATPFCQECIDEPAPAMARAW
ncbi:MAG TPA: TraR/DksA C4-type zinc finger protein [Usitatibacteraceae bacterium]|nr:TraR/DksA C4-type zinc finger protein [Usitatibacteraceae bacterium]